MASSLETSNNKYVDNVKQKTSYSFVISAALNILHEVFSEVLCYYSKSFICL